MYFYHTMASRKSVLKKFPLTEIALYSACYSGWDRFMVQSNKLHLGRRNNSHIDKFGVTTVAIHRKLGGLCPFPFKDDYYSKQILHLANICMAIFLLSKSVEKAFGGILDLYDEQQITQAKKWMDGIKRADIRSVENAVYLCGIVYDYNWRRNDFLTNDLCVSVLQNANTIKKEIRKSGDGEAKLVISGPDTQGIVANNILWFANCRIGRIHDRYPGTTLHLHGLFCKEVFPNECSGLKYVKHIRLETSDILSITMRDISQEFKEVIDTWTYTPDLGEAHRQWLVAATTKLCHDVDLETAVNEICLEPNYAKCLQFYKELSMCRKYRKRIYHFFNGLWETTNNSRKLREGIELLNEYYLAVHLPDYPWVSITRMRKTIIDDVISKI